jgi:hypothetical protein
MIEMELLQERLKNIKNNDKLKELYHCEAYQMIFSFLLVRREELDVIINDETKSDRERLSAIDKKSVVDWFIDLPTFLIERIKK